MCTHSYSYVWYDEEAWSEHVDWMALAGVNVFYALTGQEEVQYKAFREFGLKDADIREFFNGPAYLTWSRGQSMQSVGSGARCSRFKTWCIRSKGAAGIHNVVWRHQSAVTEFMVRVYSLEGCYRGFTMLLGLKPGHVCATQ